MEAAFQDEKYKYITPNRKKTKQRPSKILINFSNPSSPSYICSDDIGYTDGNDHGNQSDRPVVFLQFFINVKFGRQKFKDKITCQQKDKTVYSPAYHGQQSIMLHDGVAEHVGNTENFPPLPWPPPDCLS